MNLDIEKMLPLVVAGLVTAYAWEVWIRPRVIGTGTAA